MESAVTIHCTIGSGFLGPWVPVSLFVETVKDAVIAKLWQFRNILKIKAVAIRNKMARPQQLSWGVLFMQAEHLDWCGVYTVMQKDSWQKQFNFDILSNYLTKNEVVSSNPAKMRNIAGFENTRPRSNVCSLFPIGHEGYCNTCANIHSNSFFPIRARKCCPQLENKKDIVYSI